MVIADAPRINAGSRADKQICRVYAASNFFFFSFFFPADEPDPSPPLLY